MIKKEKKFCMGMKLDLSQYGRNIDGGCFRTGCWWEYFCL